MATGRGDHRGGLGEPVGAQTIQRCRAQASPHQAIVVYAYEVDGKRYTSRPFDYEHAGDVHCKRKDAEASARAYEKAGTAVAFYDPSNPSHAVLQPADSLWMFFFGPLLLSCGGGLVALFLRQKRRHAEANPLLL